MKNLMKNKRREITVGIIVALIVVLPIVIFLLQNRQDLRQRAAGGTVELSSTVPPGIRKVGEEFYVDITLNSQDNNISAYDITLQYNNNILTAIGAVASPPFTHIINQLNDSSGTIRLISISKIPASGVVTVGKVAFRAKNPGNANINYSTIKLAALGSGSTHIPSSQTSATVNVGSGPTVTPTITSAMCPGGLSNCANDSGSNYSCTGTKIYIGNTTQDNWCKTNGGAGSREWCWKCVSTPAVTTVCTFSSKNVISVTAGVSKTFSINASNLQSGTTSVGFTSGTDKLFKDYSNSLPLNSTMTISTTNSNYTNSTAGGNQTFTFNINTTPQTPVGNYTLDAVFLSNSGNKTQCIYSGLGGLVINVSAPGGTKTCYKDSDGDGYGNSTGGIQTNQSSCSSGWSLTNNDCYDSNPGAYPGQTGYFGVQRGDGSFDYNCNGSVEKKYAKNSFNISQTATCVSNMPSGTVGFVNDTGCGTTAAFRLCYKWNTSACGSADTASSKSESIGQTCPAGTMGNGWALVDGGSVQQQCK